MSNVRIENSASTSITAGINNTATSISVVDGSKFPSIGVDQYFYATLEEIGDFDNTEIVKVTAVVGNVLTVLRGAENTNSRSFTVGATIEQRITAATILELIPSSIDELDDVDIPSPSDGELMVYSQSLSKWISGTVAPNSLQLAGQPSSYYFSEGHAPEISEVNGLVAALSDKLALAGTAADSNKLGGVNASSFFSTLHRPELSEVNGLVAALDGKLGTSAQAADAALLGGQSINYFFNEGHYPEMTEVSGLVDTLNLKYSSTNKPAVADVTGLQDELDFLFIMAGGGY